MALFTMATLSMVNKMEKVEALLKAQTKREYMMANGSKENRMDLEI